MLRWRAQDVGQQHMGAVAENSLLQTALLAALRRSAHAHGLGPHTPLTAQHAPPDPAPTAGRGSRPAVPPEALRELQPGVTCLWPASVAGLSLPGDGGLGQGAGGGGDAGRATSSGAAESAPPEHGGLAELTFEVRSDAE